MADIFAKSQAQERQFLSFQALLDKLAAQLTPYGDCAPMEKVEGLAASFRDRLADFYQEDRKFNLAVIGQVKSGKSTFLNTLLFGGVALLPRASTPKTAALTRIEHAEENRLEIEYYTREEWDTLAALAASPLQSPQARAARETVSMAVDQGTPLERCLSLGSEIVSFESAEALAGRLNDYVGENGQYTPAVKWVTLGTDLPALRHLSVVDTPGLNDPIISRTQRTKQFIEICDAAFFLSHSSYFLDRNDLQLLTRLLPQKGVNSLTLVASQFDSAVIDALPDYADLDEAIWETRVALRRHAAKSVDDVLLTMRAGKVSTAVTEVVEKCRRPVFVSAVAQLMSEKEGGFDRQEEIIAQRLTKEGEPPSAQTLGEIGNFGEVRQEFSVLAEAKDETLAKRAASFVVVAQADLWQTLEEMRGTARERIARLEAQQRELNERLREVSGRITAVRRDVEKAFEEYLAPLDKAMAGAVFGLKELENDWAEPEEKTEIEVITRTKLVSASKFYAPWTWGKKNKIYTSEEQSYTYLDPEDISRNLKNLSESAAGLLETVFEGFQSTARLRNSLFDAASAHFAPDSPVRDPQWLHQTVDSIFPYLGLERGSYRSPPEISSLPSRFDGPVRDVLRQQELREASKSAAASILYHRRNSLERFATNLREGAAKASRGLGDDLCRELIDERVEIADKVAAMARDCNRCREAVEIMERYMPV